ncbi:hypothetical protein ETB97_002106 [Aspergillus alliaceus]|uniref:Uncharacterized protein n=1 Tax=Petromyces alliaceus TaxID=209559 RepID=A0A8H6A3P3_PETAA|nr:hypothetical protein ETB97_002106 [Aspergillus burnettii]
MLAHALDSLTIAAGWGSGQIRRDHSSEVSGRNNEHRTTVEDGRFETLSRHEMGSTARQFVDHLEYPTEMDISKRIRSND